MAPEQMQSRPVDARADIWALGAILYQALSGKHAFDGNTLPEVCAKVLGQDPPPLRGLQPQLPSELEQVVTRCLKKNPDDRYGDVASFALALAPFGTANAQRSTERIGRVLTGTSARIAKIGTAPTVAVNTPMAGAATYANAQVSGKSNRIVFCARRCRGRRHRCSHLRAAFADAHANRRGADRRITRACSASCRYSASFAQTKRYDRTRSSCTRG
jgi:hypothetical protein